MSNRADKIKEFHKQQIKDFFFRTHSASKKELSKATGISQTTCTTILQELLAEEYLKQGLNREATGGRPEKCYVLNKNNAFYCLVWIQRVATGIINSIKVLNQGQEEIYQQDFPAFTWQMEDFVSQLQKVSDLHLPIKAMAISIPGIIEGNNVLTCDIEELTGCPLVDTLKQYFPVDIVIENDVNLAVIGQHGQESSIAFLFQAPSACAGSGIILNNQLYRGKSLFAGEICHLDNCKSWSKALSSREEAQEQLYRYINAIICMWNPEKLAIYSAFEPDESKLRQWLKDNFMPIHHPVLEVLDSMDRPLFKGLLEIAYDSQRSHIQLGEFKRF